MEKTILLKD